MVQLVDISLDWQINLTTFVQTLQEATYFIITIIVDASATCSSGDVSLQQFPYCDGSHNQHNNSCGDNVGPLIVKSKE